jgi:predicted small metal-binding protein
MKAGTLIVAPRMPPPAKAQSGTPFETLGDVVVDCGETGCGWHAMGSRADVKKAWDDHYRQYHSMQTGVVLINHPQQ